MKVKISKYPKNINKKRKVKIKLTNDDVFSADLTLSLIIVPILKRLRKVKHGSPFVENSDVPKELHSPLNCSDDIDENWHKRWDYVLNKMIWSFKEIQKNYENKFYVNGILDIEGFMTHENLISEGFSLFGKYYRGLWY